MMYIFFHRLYKDCISRCAAFRLCVEHTLFQCALVMANSSRRRARADLRECSSVATPSYFVHSRRLRRVDKTAVVIVGCARLVGVSFQRVGPILYMRACMCM